MRELTHHSGRRLRWMAQLGEQMSRMTIGQVTLAVRDLDRAVEFYGGKLGLILVSRAENAAFFDGGGARLALERSRAEELRNSMIYFQVDDLAPAVAGMRERGIVFEREAHLVARFPGHDLWSALFRDEEGNRVGLMCERRRGTG